MKYLGIAFLLVACNNLSVNDIPKVSVEKLDTLQRPATVSAATPALFETAFIKGTTQKQGRTEILLYGVNVGNIKITSGRIIACDPMHIDEYGKPFTQIFPIGSFPVQLSIARFDDEEKVAMARILFSKEPVVRWEFALLAGESQVPLGQEKRHGYSVDAGVGVFIDQEANKALDFKKMVANSNGTVYQAMDSHYRVDWKYALYHFGDYNLAAFTSGEGDGYYSTYIGFDAQGRPCRLLTDFNLLNWK